MKRTFTLFFFTVLSISGFAQYNFVQKSHLAIQDNEYSNIWGYAQNNKEYALIGCQGSATLNDACAIIDVTNPSSPQTLFKVQGPTSLWREVRTWQHYAYVTTEASDNTFGITIVDLQYLPDSIRTKQYTANGLISNVHALHIDNGFLYLYGANNQTSQGGALILDITDPWNPTVAGAYSTRYVHDGIVRDNKMYAGEIFNGTFSIVDVTNKSQPVVINSQFTPNAFTHNTWLSTDSKYLFTTDEKPDSYVASYDVSNPLNIVELDRYRRPLAGGAIPHNTYVLRDSLVTGTNTDWVHTSYYTMGTTIVDAAKPDNLVEVAHFDTSPLTGNGYQGAWGVYPFLPSGNVLVSDMELGLFVLEPTYQRACYLEGTITDANTNLPIPNARVTFVGNSNTKNGKANGTYKTGIVTQGDNVVRFSAPGYQTKELTVSFVRAQVTTLDVQLIQGTSGIEEESATKFNVYPRAVKQELFIERLQDSNAQISLSDLSGRLVYQENISGLKSIINLNKLTSGTYILRISENDKVLHTEKIIKQ